MVEISEESINALKNYVTKAQTASEDDSKKADSAASEKSTGNNYTYDYMTLKKQRTANQAAIEQETAGQNNAQTESAAGDSENSDS